MRSGKARWWLGGITLLCLAGTAQFIGLFEGVRFASAAPVKHFTQKWATPTHWAWGEVISGMRSFQFQPDGGLIYLSDYNDYFIAPDGADRQSPAWDDSVAQIGIGTPVLMLPTGGFCTTDKELGCYGADGATLWKLGLKTEYGSSQWEGSTQLALGPGGDIYAFSEDRAWQVSPAGQLRREFAFPLRPYGVLDSRSAADGLHLLTQDQTSGSWSLSLQVLDGKRLWHLPLQPRMGPIITATLLPDDSAVVAIEKQGLARIDNAGKPLWCKHYYYPGFDERSYLVMPSGVIVAWWGPQLRFWKQDGTQAAPPVWLGTEADALMPDRLCLIAGADGNIYVQTGDVQQHNHPVKRNRILAVTPHGDLLWRLELGTDNFQLFAIGTEGQLYGRRVGKSTGSTGFSGGAEAEFLCLEVKP